MIDINKQNENAMLQQIGSSFVFHTSQYLEISHKMSKLVKDLEKI